MSNTQVAEPGGAPAAANSHLSPAYVKLRDMVRRSLFAGKQKIEQVKVEMYWDVGNHIHRHILLNLDRADYGKHVLSTLASDLRIEDSLLYRCLDFARKFPELKSIPEWRKLSWSHYRELLSINDETKRLELLDLAAKEEITVGELRSRIKADRLALQGEVEVVGAEPSAAEVNLLTPLRGKLYTYRIVRSKAVSNMSERPLFIDLGFSIYWSVEKYMLRGLDEGDVVQSVPDREGGKLNKISGSPDDLFTYLAVIESVIDANTFRARIDVGFGIWTRQIVHLRGIEARELASREGLEAKEFVRARLKTSPFVTVRSTRSPDHERYLADIFLSQEGAADDVTDIYLNNLLLQNGYAFASEGR